MFSSTPWKGKLSERSFAELSLDLIILLDLRVGRVLHQLGILRYGR